MKNFRTITLVAILVIAMTLTLTACDDGNAVTEATSEPTSIIEATPRPEPTPEPTPEPEEPSCEHVWQEANFQQPQMCLECGEIEGEPLTPGFFEYDEFTLNSTQTDYEYLTRTEEYEDIIIYGIANAHPLVIIEYDDYREAKEGFEWRILTVELYFYGLGVEHFGRVIGFSSNLDFYHFSMDGNVRSLIGNVGNRTINFYGNAYEVTVMTEHTSEWTDDIIHGEWVLISTFEFSALVPIGYDGMMVAFFNAARSFGVDLDSLSPSDLFDENTLFFRLG